MALLWAKCKKNISIGMSELNNVIEKALDHEWPLILRWQRAKQGGPDYRGECLSDYPRRHSCVRVRASPSTKKK